MRTADAASLDLAQYIQPRDLVVWGQGCAEPLTLTGMLAAQRASLGGVRCFHGISRSSAVAAENCDFLSFTSYSGAGANRALAAAGCLDILPVHYCELPDVLGAQVDVLLLAVPPVRPDGSFGWGAGADYPATLLGRARTVIAEVNDRLPDVAGGPALTPADIDVAVPVSRPVPQSPPAPPRGTEDAIAAHVANLIPDGATIQLGIGAIPSAIASRLRGHRDLGIHSGVITDAVAELIEAGVVTGARKAADRGLAIAGFLLGTERLLELAGRNSAIQVRDTRYTHDPAVLAAQHRLVAINSALEVDLTGSVNSETAAGRYVGAVGGASDFLRAAARADGGIPVIALPATAGPASRIVTQLTGPASQARADAGVIVTEYGVADLRGCTLAQRRERMLAIAHPEHRAALEAADRKEHS